MLPNVILCSPLEAWLYSPPLLLSLIQRFFLLEKNLKMVYFIGKIAVIFFFHRYPSELDMQKIVQCLLTPIFDKFKNITNSANIDQLAVAMINVYTEVSACF